MLLKSSFISLALFLLSTSETVVGRYQWLERDNKHIALYPRRFGQERPPAIEKLAAACPGQICGTLAGAAITPLLAAQPECSQQDMADAIIDASRQFDAATQANMIAIAIEYRQAEKNTPPDFTANPPIARNSVFCQKAPQNAELNGLVQAQDPNNDPNVFFDPALRASVLRGTQANTEPFNGGGAAAPPAQQPPAQQPPAQQPPANDNNDTETETATALPQETTAAPAECPAVVTVTVTGTAAAPTDANAPTVVVGTPAAPAPTAVGDADFGRCSVPQIEFGQGFDGRRETSFQPVDQASFSQGSAQNINIITRAICDTLVNACQANQAARDLCAQGQTAAAAATAGSGLQADAFNAVFGIQTNFAAVQAFDDQGRPVGTPAAGGAAAGGAAADAPAPTAAPAPAPAPAPSAGAVGSFGSCTVPEIEFGAGFDNRRETSFRPKDLNSFDHGSAQNIDIITQFICDELTNSCDADDAAKATCAQAEAAASAAAKGTGAQADAFNAVFGIQTNFAAVTQIDNTGREVPSANNGGAAPARPAAGNNDNSNQNQNQNDNNNNNEEDNDNTGGAAAGGNLQLFQGALGGVDAPTVTDLGGGRFQVEGNAAFNNLRSARVRSCDVQNNQCANAANGNRNAGFSVGECNAQQAQCIAQAGN